VIFAEPVTGNTNKQLDAALLPGDRLLEVNGQNVQNTNREDIIDIIRNSGSTVTLKVCFIFDNDDENIDENMIAPALHWGR
jgi:myosin-18